MTERLEEQRITIAAVKADHTKQHKLYKQQIHDLREKLNKSEVSSIKSWQCV